MCHVTCPTGDVLEFFNDLIREKEVADATVQSAENMLRGTN
jgi:hypothetical protein